MRPALAVILSASMLALAACGSPDGHPPKGGFGGGETMQVVSPIDAVPARDIPRHSPPPPKPAEAAPLEEAQAEEVLGETTADATAASETQTAQSAPAPALPPATGPVDKQSPSTIIPEAWDIERRGR